MIDDCRQGSAGQVFSSNGKQGGITRVKGGVGEQEQQAGAN
jgi:hypothetical protein